MYLLSIPYRSLYFLVLLLTLVIIWPANAENILYQENFDTCNEITTAWTFNGVDTDGTQQLWQVGVSANPLSLNPSIDGSCMLYFDDNNDDITSVLDNGSLATSPNFDGSVYAKIMLAFDVHFKADENNNATLTLVVSDGTTSRIMATYTENTNGNDFNNYLHEEIDISSFRSSSMSVAFNFDDGGSEAWWAGVDNISITGVSSISCANAEAVVVNDLCSTGGNALSIFEGDVPSCLNISDGAVWYTFIAPASGSATVKTNALFNDVVSIFEGVCGSFTEIACENTDEFGFEGETAYLNDLTPNNTYYVRISGVLDTFGRTQGDFCLSVTDGVNIPNPPTNNLCADAITVNVTNTCLTGDNFEATFNGPVPSLNNKSRNSVWYAFDAPANGDNLLITTDADFSDVITVFSGSCASLTEVACNDMGLSLELISPIPNETYLVQISSYFATIEGNFCIAIQENTPSPANDLCANATPITIGDACNLQSNEAAGFEDVYPSCEIIPAASVWYSFVAPASGNLGINTGADFIHVLSVYGGACGALNEVACVYNPYRCDGNVLINNLIPGDTYFIQITAAQNSFGYMQGNVCVQLNNVGNEPIKVQTKAFLEGAFDASTNTMRTNLAAAGLIPTEQPFNTAPWLYYGAECMAIAPTNMVDWVLLELRDANDIHSVVDQKAAQLLADGSIVDDKQNGVYFDNASINENYFIVIRHRNHLDVVSNGTLMMTNEDEDNIYDFSANANQAMAQQLVAVAPNTFALLAGDGNGDGVITVVDFNAYAQQAATINQYLTSDFTMDGNVTVADFNLYQPNASSIGVSAIRY